jgi:predicted RNA-binding Zn-ribbon protein involved in translation (DUF1610 family)
MSDIAFDCPECSGHLVVDAQAAGRVVNCPQCSKQIRIPRSGNPTSSPPPTPAVEEKQHRDCPYCGEQILASAIKCKHCGEFLDGRPKQQAPIAPQPQGRKCPHCGAHGVGKVRGLQGIGETFVAVILFFLFLIPGIIYYIYMESVPYCSSCGRRVY